MSESLLETLKIFECTKALTPTHTKCPSRSCKTKAEKVYGNGGKSLDYRIVSLKLQRRALG